MSLNNGSGAVIQKNILVSDTMVGEKLVAIKHANGRDWWLITHYQDIFFTAPPNNLFIKYLITPNGISAPIYQSIGTLLFGSGGSFGEMQCNLTGDKIAFCG